jgi:hypothetical protein
VLSTITAARQLLGFNFFPEATAIPGTTLTLGL